MSLTHVFIRSTWGQVISLLIDIPFLVAALLVFVTLLRADLLLTATWHAQDGPTRRKIVARELGLLLLTALTLPGALLLTGTGSLSKPTRILSLIVLSYLDPGRHIVSPSKIRRQALRHRG